MLIGAVVYAKDRANLQSFYEHLGFSTQEGDDSYSLLKNNESELTLIQAPDEILKQIELGDPVVSRAHIPTKLVFLVDSIEASAALINQQGGRIDRGQARWQFGQYFVQDAVDPEGNIIQLRELSN